MGLVDVGSARRPASRRLPPPSACFQELRFGRRDKAGDTPQSGPTGEAIAVDLDAVLPMRRNPRSADHPEGSPIWAAHQEFNQTYCYLLYLLEQAFNGDPSQLRDSIRVMNQLRAQALKLTRTPDGDGVTAGLTFEYVPQDLRT